VWKPWHSALAVGGGLAVVVGGLVLFIAHGGLIEIPYSGISVNVSSCGTDGDVPAADRQPYETAALAFTRLVLTGQGKDAYRLLSDGAKKTGTQEQFRVYAETLAKGLPNISGTLHVVHSYRYVTAGIVQPDQISWNTCTLTAGSSPGTPANTVQVALMGVPLQSYVIVEGAADDSIWAAYLWITPKGRDWIVENFYVSAAALAGRSTQDVVAMARAQAKKGNVFNAWMLYRGAISTLNGGPNFKYGLASDIEKEALALDVPADVKGAPPYIWKSGDQSFRIVLAEAAGSRKDLVLYLRQEIAQWADNTALDAQNQQLLKILHAAHPEYRDVFDKVVVEGFVPSHNGDGYRSVETVKQPAN
jgi:hypothetical protein